MNRKNSALFTFVFLLLLSSSVCAAEGGYISAHISPSFLDDATFTKSNGYTAEAEFETGIGIGTAIGYDFGAYRVEGEVGYRTHDIDNGSGEISALSLLINGFLQLKTNTPFTPYAGVGIGFASLNVEDVRFRGIDIGDSDDTVFAYQLGAGVGYAITPSVTLDLGYRYFATSDPDFDGVDAEYGSHNFSMGVRFAFK